MSATLSTLNGFAYTSSMPLNKLITRQLYNRSNGNQRQWKRQSSSQPIQPPTHACHKRWNASRPLRRIVVSFCLSDCSLECCILLPKSPSPLPSQLLLPLPLPLPSPIILIITVVVVAHPAPGKRVHTHVRLLSSLIMGPCAIRPCIWSKMWVMFGTRFWPEKGIENFVLL